MSSIPSNIARVTGSLVADTMTSNLRRTNVALLKAQEQLSTGLRVNRPSDDASVISSLSILDRTLSQFDQQITNLSRAQATIDTTDQALADVSNLLLEAESIASSQIGIGSDAATRESEAAVIDGMITALIGIANREVRGIHLFGGATPAAQPFVDELGGLRYVGSRDNLQADLGLVNPVGVNSNGVEAFGSLSSRVESMIDLDPVATATTRLENVAGARNQGVAIGAIRIDVDGTDIDLDLTGADSLGDVVTRVNDAIDSVDPTAGALSVTANGFSLTANAGHTITIADIETGDTAADLGIDISATATTVAGGDIDPKLTELTATASFGVAFDAISGLKVTQGATSKVITFVASPTIRDMMNTIEAADLGIRLEINADGTGLNLVNEVSGSNLSIGENAGGTTASDLGLRSLDTTTELSNVNFGVGIHTAAGDDIRIHLHDGTDVDVNLSNATTFGEIISAINLAGGGSVAASLATDGNGLVITDNTVGADDFSIVNLGTSLAGTDLDILGNAGAGSTIAGSDVAQIRTDSVFTHLMMLRDALLSNDEDLITEAGSAIHDDISTVATARAQVGVRSQQLLQQANRLQEQQVQTQALISDLQDADYNEVISRFMQLQQQLEANLLTGRQALSLSLLDFLR